MRGRPARHEGRKLREILRADFLSYEKKENSGKTPKDAPTLESTDSVHAKMMELDPLLEASGAGK